MNFFAAAIACLHRGSGVMGGGRKRLSVIQKILLRHLKAGFEKKG